MTRREQYRELCEKEPSIPIFSRAWWLDAVCGAAWDVCLLEKGGEVVAALPYHFRKRYGFTRLTQPPLTQTLGPWLKPSEAKYAKRMSREKELLTALARQLPPFALYQQNWHHGNTNWLPFFWEGFQQTTRYTYRIASLDDPGRVWNGFRENIRSDIRKAQRRFGLQVRRNADIETLLELNARTFHRQGLDQPYPSALVRELDRVCSSREARQLFVATDDAGRAHACAYIVFDEHAAYYLIGGSDPELRSSGAMSLCLWEALQYSATKTRSFDFEGSMIEPVERFFRAFGAVQTPYFQVTSVRSRTLAAGRCLQKILASRAGPVC